MEPTAAYDTIAEWYDGIVRSGSLAGDIVLDCLFSLLGSVTDQVICDLACGQGRLARVLAQRGASVIGLDISRELIAIAERDEAAHPLGIQYYVDNAEQVSSIADNHCDGVICNLAFMDMPNVSAVCAAIYRILRPNGWFVCSLTHPCFESPHAQWHTHTDGSIRREIITYFPEVFWRSSHPYGVRGQVGAYHRTLSTYINICIQAGLSIDHIIEPQPHEGESIANEGYRLIPSFLLIRCIKGSKSQ